MIRKGVDIKLVSEMLGHSSVSFTYNTYVHLIEEEKAKVIQQLDI
jgi:site-specific recombinase XerD